MGLAWDGPRGERQRRFLQRSWASASGVHNGRVMRETVCGVREARSDLGGARTFRARVCCEFSGLPTLRSPRDPTPYPIDPCKEAYSAPCPRQNTSRVCALR
eukprot:3262796-Pyramimonas_sp.AAC.1